MYKKSSIFLIDIDGVACAHAKAICEWVNKEYKLSSKVTDVTTWDHDFGPITFVEAVKKYYRDKDFILNMEVTLGFREFLDCLTEMMTVKFASSREYSQEATAHWVKRKFGNYEVLFVDRKAKLKVDYIIDDCPEEVLGAADKGIVSFLLRQPWNDNKTTREKLRSIKCAHFVSTFLDVFNSLKSFEKG